jgi:hypothetical protein
VRTRGPRRDAEVVRRRIRGRPPTSGPGPRHGLTVRRGGTGAELDEDRGGTTRAVPPPARAGDGRGDPRGERRDDAPGRGGAIIGADGTDPDGRVFTPPGARRSGRGETYAAPSPRRLGAPTPGPLEGTLTASAAAARPPPGAPRESPRIAEVDTRRGGTRTLT